MSKEKQDAAEQIEALPDEASGRSVGPLTILAIVTIVGIAIWFIASQNEAS